MSENPFQSTPKRAFKPIAAQPSEPWPIFLQSNVVLLALYSLVMFLVFWDLMFVFGMLFFYWPVLILTAILVFVYRKTVQQTVLYSLLVALVLGIIGIIVFLSVLYKAAN